MPRGGRRAGAGAPKGNLNALKHGRNSGQYQRLLQILAEDPETLRLVREIVLGNEARQERRRSEALAILQRVIEHHEDRANERITAAYEASRAIPHSVLSLEPASRNPVPAINSWIEDDEAEK